VPKVAFNSPRLGTWFNERSFLRPKRLIYFFMNNIINLKGNCVLRTLKLFFGREAVNS
jgi:hypothetical protein